MTETQKKILPYFLISLVSALVFVPFIGNCPLFDWDEVNFAECAREMLVSGDYSHVQINFRPFWEKPPLFIWLQAISMNIFGINEFAARFPNAMCSIISLCSLYAVGQKLYSQRVAWLWVGFYLCSLLPHFYFKTGIIDPWFNLFIFLSFVQMHFMWSAASSRPFFNAVLSGVFLGLAVLTKGPAALLIVAVSILFYVIYSRKFKLLIQPSFFIFGFSTVLIASSWFITEWLKGNGALIAEFIDYQLRLAETQDAGHGGPFYYHVIVLLLGCFPASLVFLNAVTKKTSQSKTNDAFKILMLSLFFSVLIIFSFVTTKIVHYSSLAYFPLTFIAALYFKEDGVVKFPVWSKTIYWICSILIATAALIIGLSKYILPTILEKGLLKDEFVLGNLQAQVNWTGWEFLLAVLFVFGAATIYKAMGSGSVKWLSAGLLINLLFVSLSINLFAPKIELYTQHAAIEFYKSCAGRNCHLETHGFKSYAYLFYSNRKPEDFKGAEQQRFIEEQLNYMVKEGRSRIKSYATANQLWMEHGIVDRPAFIVAKIPVENKLKTLPGMRKLYDMNGYAFFVRMPLETAK